MIEHYDFLRSALMLEPRGHRDMFGALPTEPVHEEADAGVIFMDSGGCLNMCGHGSIGTAYTLVEMGMVEVKEPYTEVVLDAPSGIIRTKVHVVNVRAVEVSILNVPSFLYKEGLSVDIPARGTIPFDISFGGSFFALVNAEEIHLSLEAENIDNITSLGMELLDRINQTVKVNWELFRRQGFSETTIDDVVKQARVSEEDFYDNFSAKEDLEDTLGDLFDQKYAELMLSMDPRLSHYEKLLYLNQELFGLIEEKVPFNLVSHLYVGMDKDRQNLLNRNRFYYKLIPQIIEEGQKTGEFIQDDTSENLADNYASLERGMIYDWCIKGGNYNLKEKSRHLLPIYLKSLVR